jgi:hypothetical protein
MIRVRVGREKSWSRVNSPDISVTSTWTAFNLSAMALRSEASVIVDSAMVKRYWACFGGLVVAEVLQTSISNCDLRPMMKCRQAIM